MIFKKKRKGNPNPLPLWRHVFRIIFSMVCEEHVSYLPVYIASICHPFPFQSIPHVACDMFDFSHVSYVTFWVAIFDFFHVSNMTCFISSTWRMRLSVLQSLISSTWRMWLSVLQSLISSTCRMWLSVLQCLVSSTFLFYKVDLALKLALSFAFDFSCTLLWGFACLPFSTSNTLLTNHRHLKNLFQWFS